MPNESPPDTVSTNELSTNQSPHLPPVADAEAGERLDRWLSTHLPDVSRTRLKVLIEEGRVSVNGATLADASARVKPGNVICLSIPPARPADPEAQSIPLDILYEDQDVIVLNKPSGLVVHPAPGSPDQTLVNALLAHCGDSLSGIGGVKRPGIVHRLDKDTSGIMVVAKNDEAHHALASQFEAHTIARAYLALVWGTPNPLKGEIEGNIGRSPTNRKKMAIVSHGGKWALTRYQVKRSFAQGALSLVECRLATGRTHQIRVHMTAKGHPLVGDQTYGGGSKASRTRLLSPEVKVSITQFPRQALHAALLGFTHPITGQKMEFTQDLPQDLSDLMAVLDTL